MIEINNGKNIGSSVYRNSWTWAQICLFYSEVCIYKAIVLLPPQVINLTVEQLTMITTHFNRASYNTNRLVLPQTVPRQKGRKVFSLSK